MLNTPIVFVSMLGSCGLPGTPAMGTPTSAAGEIGGNTRVMNTPRH